MKKIRYSLLLIGIVLLSNFKMFGQKKELEIVFRVFPLKFLSDTSTIRKELKNTSPSVNIESKLKKLVSKYYGYRVQICYYFDKTKYYIFYSNETGQTSEEIVTGTRGIEQALKNESELLSYWKNKLLVFDYLSIPVNFDNGSFYGRTYFLSKDNESNMMLKKTETSLEIWLKDSLSKDRSGEIITINGKRADTLHLSFVDTEFKREILNCFKNLTIGNDDQANDLAVDVIIKLYSDMGLIDKKSLINYLSADSHD